MKFQLLETTAPFMSFQGHFFFSPLPLLFYGLIELAGSRGCIHRRYPYLCYMYKLRDEVRLLLFSALSGVRIEGWGWRSWVRQQGVCMTACQAAQCKVYCVHASLCAVRLRLACWDLLLALHLLIICLGLLLARNRRSQGDFLLQTT